MLNPLRSLRGRFALIVLAMYAVVFAVGFALLTWKSLSTGGESHQAGPGIAMEYALDEVTFEDGKLRFPPDGWFSSLASRNPGLWLLARDASSDYAFGPVPIGARALFENVGGALDSGRFHVPGVKRPLSDAIVTTRAPVLIAVGGVDPATITRADAWHYLALQGVLFAALCVGAGGLLATVAALPLLTAALRPLTRDVALLRAETPSRRLREDAVPSELLPLVRAFNAALARLEVELTRRRAFIRDVAHELRTPLAIMSLQVENLGDEDRKQEMRRVVARMTQMVAQMLDVERLVAQAGGHAPVDLVALARDAIAEIAPLAIEAGYDLSLSAPNARVEVIGDSHALARALANLLANAIAHGGGGGAIEVLVAPERHIDVIDSGPGVPEDLRASLFEPFSRGSWDRDGCGMGLHLTREIIRAHGGEAMLVETESGAHFRLAFPDHV